MELININKIFETLSREDFKDSNSGLLFFPVYIYTYPPEQEYQVRKMVSELNEKLKRPSNSLNCLTINIYEEFIKYLKNNTFSNETLFDSVLDIESENYTDALEFLAEQAESDEFISSIGEKFQKYFEQNEADKVYLILHGFGSIFPYLRLSSLLKKSEQFTKKLKIITFYPGEFRNLKYSLFCHFDDDNVYRANHLNQFL